MNEPCHRLHTLHPRFYSDETGAPFQNCYDCGLALNACEDGYFIQKAYAGSETVMEMAICIPCHEKLQRSYSKESLDRIWNFYLDHGDLAGRLKKFYPIPVGNPDFWINSCVTCGSVRSSIKEYVLAAQVIEDGLVYGDLPLMICCHCMEKITALLSEESRDTYDRWLDRVLPAAPEISGQRPRIRIFM